MNIQIGENVQNDNRDRRPMNKMGFTLAELLIVVAIVAVLVAISIPVFMGQLEKSRQAADLANIRSAYAVAALEAIDSPEQEGRADTVPMQHSGPFTKLEDASIGHYALDDIAGTDMVVKGFPVTVVFDAINESLSLEFGWTDGSRGDIAQNIQVNAGNGKKGAVISDAGVTDEIGVYAAANYGNSRDLTLAYKDGDVFKEDTHTGQYGVKDDTIYKLQKQVLIPVKDENGDPVLDENGKQTYNSADSEKEYYFKWDGKGWLYTTGENDTWKTFGHVSD